ncbi:MAG: GNAT family N-acetyltransferase [Candidatus Eisenbacteria bacterium]|nr:GNAT family N-acetyltransferase [Candidatus Eisenbacteria bacterium]
MDESRQPMNRDALFRSFPTLDTDRCELREVPLRCADDLFRIRSDPEGARLGPEAWTDPRQAEDRIREWHKWFLAKEDVPWGVFLRGEDRLIGHIKYAYVRQYLGVIGYHLHIDFWNKGIMTEVLRAVVRFLYESTDAYRLQATVHSEHGASARVLEKVGFKREGLLRGRAFWHGRFCDLYMYALLRGEQVV